MQYPGYEIERFEDEGGKSYCYYRYKKAEDLESIPVNELSGDDEHGDKNFTLRSTSSPPKEG
jgi:hypothetical protein